LKIRTQPKTQGGALPFALLTASVIGFTLASYLTLVSSQNASVMRSLSWNHAVAVAEAGVEEALTQLHYTGITNLWASNWKKLDNGLYYKRCALGNGTYTDVTIRPVEPPVIISTAFVPAPLSPASQMGMILGLASSSSQPASALKRKIQVNTAREALFTKAMLAKGQIDLNGNNVTTDSFDSTTIEGSTNGKYDPAKRRANGDVATNSGLVDSFKMGNANIMGHVSTGPRGTISIGSNGSVGDKKWVLEDRKTGIQPGYSSDDMNVEFPDVVLPPGTPTIVYSGSYSQGNTNYNYVLKGSATEQTFFKTSSLNGKVYVSGNVQLWITDSFNMSGGDLIYLAPGANLKLYVGAASATLSGQGISNPGSALNFQYYGLNSNTSLTFSGNGAFTGTIYAPYANFNLKGSGSNLNDFIGASVSKTVTMTGNFNFHYDEALILIGPLKDYIVTAWNELDPNSAE
jgi:hypothetical protein